MPRISSLAGLHPSRIERLDKKIATNWWYKRVSPRNRFVDTRLAKRRLAKEQFSRPAVRLMLEALEDRVPAGAIATAQPIAMAAGLDAFGLYSDHSLMAEAASVASLHISSHSAALDTARRKSLALWARQPLCAR
jgi:hypothetical protein